VNKSANLKNKMPERDGDRGTGAFPQALVVRHSGSALFPTGFAGQGDPAREATDFRQAAKTVYRI
jgi:hypothetical protein